MKRGAREALEEIEDAAREAGESPEPDPSRAHVPQGESDAGKGTPEPWNPGDADFYTPTVREILRRRRHHE